MKDTCTIEELEAEISALLEEKIEEPKQSIYSMFEEYKRKISQPKVIQSPERSCINCVYLQVYDCGGHGGTFYNCEHPSRPNREVGYKDSLDCELIEYKNK